MPRGVVGLVGVVGGALAGAWFGAAVLARERARAAEVATTPSTALESARSKEATALSVPSNTARIASDAANASAALEPADCPLFGDVHRAHGERGIRDAWATLRKDEPDAVTLAAGLAEYESLVLGSPRGIGARLARAQNATDAALEDAKRGGLFALLKALDEGDAGPIVDEVRDAKRIDAYFQRSSTSSALVDGPSNGAHPDKALDDGGTLSFPAGVFQVMNLMREKDPFPRDVTVSGAGMNATLLVLSGALSTRGELVNLTLRDCTVHTNGHYLTDLRSNPASMTFERVRFVGFDSGAGGSCLLAANAIAVRAVDCHVVGGYGRLPRSGSLFDVRSNALVARFERCHIEQVDLEVQHLRPGSTVVMIGCTLSDLLDTQALESHGHAGLFLDGCVVSYLPNGPQAAQAKDLNALFPDWQARMVR